MLPNTMIQKLKHLRTKRRLEVVVAVTVVLALLLLCWVNGRREKDPVRHLRTRKMRNGGGGAFQVMDTPGLKSGARDVVLAEIGRNLTLSSSLRLIYPLRIQFFIPVKNVVELLKFFFKYQRPVRTVSSFRRPLDDRISLPGRSVQWKVLPSTM